MSADFEKRKKDRLRVAYETVKNLRPDLYTRAVELGHIPRFEPDVVKAAAKVEAAVMELIAELIQ